MSTSTTKIALTSIYDGIVQRGFSSTVLMIFAVVMDCLSSKIRGIHSHPYLDPKDSKNQTLNSKFGNYFQPVRVGPFLKLLESLPLDRNSNFVDIGAGSGKAMYLAAEAGWKNIRGCEICSELVEVAKNNIELAIRRFPGVRIEIQLLDAMDFRFLKEDKIIYFNDPFYEPLFSQFLEKLVAHHKESKEEIIVIYKNNSMREIKRFKTNSFSSLGVREILGNRFELYKLSGI